MCRNLNFFTSENNGNTVLGCWPLKKTLRRVFPTSQENMREECFEAAQELEISFVREILFD